MGFPYTFPILFPTGGGIETDGPAITFGVGAGAIHENRAITVTIADDTDLAYVRIEVHYPTGYFEVAYETGLAAEDVATEAQRLTYWGQFYSGSSMVFLEPMSGVARTWTIVRDLHWPNDFDLKVTARDTLGNVTPL